MAIMADIMHKIQQQQAAQQQAVRQQAAQQQAAQQQIAAQHQIAAQYGTRNYAPGVPAWQDINILHAQSPTRIRLQHAVEAIAFGLPWAIARKLARVRGEVMGSEARIVVTFRGVTPELVFPYEDGFPGPEVEARIALECP